MPRRELLMPAQRFQLFAFPDDESELIRRATQSKEDSRVGASTPGRSQPSWRRSPHDLPALYGTGAEFIAIASWRRSCCRSR